jgi:hypothetical protein
LEVKELLFTQASRASRATTMETTRSINSIATSIRSIIDLSQNDNSNFANIGIQQYDSDSDNLETVLPVNEVVNFIKLTYKYMFSLIIDHGDDRIISVW